MRNADKSPKIPYSAMVSEVKWKSDAESVSGTGSLLKVLFFR